MSEDITPSEKQAELKAVYKLAISTRNFEIQQLITRNNFFMLFQGVLLAAVFSNQESKPFVEFVICIAGVVVSWHQISVAAGAKYWQEWWELKTSEIEHKLKEAIGDQGFISLFDLNDINSHQDQSAKIISKINKHSGFIESWVNSQILKKHSVSRVPIRSGLILMFTWIALFLSTIDWDLLFNGFEFVKLIKGHYFASK